MKFHFIPILVDELGKLSLFHGAYYSSYLNKDEPGAARAQLHKCMKQCSLFLQSSGDMQTG